MTPPELVAARDRALEVRRTVDGFRPWWAQRLASRLEREALIVLGVAGRQGGKTEWGTWRVVRRAALRPGGHSLILVPTYRMGLVHSARLQKIAAELRAEWKEHKQVLILRNGHHVWLRSADRPDAARGLTIDTTLWVDEAALVTEIAWQAALGCLVAARDPLVLVTTTPKGKGNWVYRLWSRPGNLNVARFLFRSQDSPYAGPVLEALRDTMGTQMTLQELDAAFLDAGGQPFPPELVERMFARPAVRREGARWVLGVDLAKSVDWTVVVAQDETGASWVVDRWQQPPTKGKDPLFFWPETERRLVQISKDHGNAPLYVDASGQGGPMVEYLARALGSLVHPVKTGIVGVKADVVEALIAEAEKGRVIVAPDSRWADEVRDEMLKFTSSPLTRGPAISYHGPEGEGQHDDCVIALALATWGRLGREPDTGDGGLARFRPRGGPSTGRRFGGGAGRIFK